jgi:adenylate kinase family enzyme
VQRVLVAGTSGSGKSTLAQALASRLGLPYTEIDSLFHGPGWEPRPSFVADVDALTAGPAWVIEWQYEQVRPLLASRADTMVWLHFSRTTVMRRIVRRTVTRRLRRVELWNGNREAPLRTFFSDPEHVVKWAWQTHAGWEAKVRAAVAENPGLQLLELRSPRETARWVESL